MVYIVWHSQEEALHARGVGQVDPKAGPVRRSHVQSLLPFTQTGHPAHRMMALRIENTLEYRHDAYLAQDTQWQSFIALCFATS